MESLARQHHENPASHPNKVEQIKAEQNSERTCKRLSGYVVNDWPEHRRDAHQLLLPDWPKRSFIRGGLLIKCVRLIIPDSRWPDILQKLDQGHRGKDVKSLHVKLKYQCNLWTTTTTDLPSTPWQRVVADLFQWQNENYLVMINYFSRYI